jgi:hypothetical protein
MTRTWGYQRWLASPELPPFQKHQGASMEAYTRLEGQISFPSEKGKFNEGYHPSYPSILYECLFAA